MEQTQISKVEASILRFVSWLDRFGETSYDHQSYFASDLARSAKALYYTKPLLGTLAVSPMIFSEAFVPSARRFFWKRQRFPIADAHYAMGFAFLSQALSEKKYYDRAVHFLEVLKETRSPGYAHYCWGYPFNWETRRGTMWQGTPLITTVPYVYEAFRGVYRIDGDPKWREIMLSIARHAAEDYHDFETSPDASSCSYNPLPGEPGGVINASAYRAFLLTTAAQDFSDNSYEKIAQRNLNFVLQSQNPDGSWYYSTDGERDFVDHFHTCFVLKALAKIEQMTESGECRNAIQRGLRYYVNNLFDSDGLPSPFSKAPRLTVYRHELYDYAECINLAVLLNGRVPELGRISLSVVKDLLMRWQKPDGSFRSRKLLVGWDSVPMHRWAQSQVFRSLSFLVFSKRERLKEFPHRDFLKQEVKSN
jgi:Prenyltransferase and squalene oxidase repeat